MKVQDVMTRAVASRRPDANLAAATALVWDRSCGQLPVVDDQGKVIGVFTDRDICIALGQFIIESLDLRSHQPAAGLEATRMMITTKSHARRCIWKSKD